MPTIAIFYGIIIQMFFEDHDPPHVHAIYAGAKALVSISSGQVIRGSLPKKQAKLAKDWGAAQACRIDGELASCAN